MAEEVKTLRFDGARAKVTFDGTDVYVSDWQMTDKARLEQQLEDIGLHYRVEVYSTEGQGASDHDFVVVIEHENSVEGFDIDGFTVEYICPNGEVKAEIYGDEEVAEPATAIFFSVDA